MPIQPSIYGNFDLVGVCFVFVDSPRTIRPFGMNFLSTAQGVESWSHVLQLARAGTIRPVIGKQIGFTEVPVRSRRWNVVKRPDARLSYCLSTNAIEGAGGGQISVVALSPALRPRSVLVAAGRRPWSPTRRGRRSISISRTEPASM